VRARTLHIQHRLRQRPDQRGDGLGASLKIASLQSRLRGSNITLRLSQIVPAEIWSEVKSRQERPRHVVETPKIGEF
jgi:hypothetical protein